MHLRAGVDVVVEADAGVGGALGVEGGGGGDLWGCRARRLRRCGWGWGLGWRGSREGCGRGRSRCGDPGTEDGGRVGCDVD